jgi:TetR/AcrR family transcriptional repressor of nem operon
MPWTKQFDVDAARERAKDLFWKKGYQATSMDDLLRSMGIGRGSFYATFRSKQEVYAEVLEMYGREHCREFLRSLREQRAPKRAIVTLFESVCEEACGSGGNRGCFLANAALELAATDKRVAQVVRRAFAEIEAFFRESIVEGQRSGEIRRDIDPETVSRTLLGLVLGMRVLARSGGCRSAVESITRQVAEML